MAHQYDKIAEAIVNEYFTYTHYTGEKKKSYDPCYFGQGYSDTNEEAVSAFVNGELTSDGYPRWREIAEDVLFHWVGDCIYHDADELTNKYESDNDVDDDFDTFELRDAIVNELQDVQTQDVHLEWIRDMRPPIVRINLTDEDHPDSWVENDADWTPERLATHAGIEHSEKNLKACQVIIDNAYYPGTCKMLYLVFRMDIPSDMSGDKVHIRGEVELWATNPFQGDGMADTVDVDMTIDRSKMLTDKDAFGYSYVEVFGAHIPSIPQPKLTFINNKKDKAA